MDIEAVVAALHEERDKLGRQMEELGVTETGGLKSETDYGDGFADAAAATAERSEVLGIAENLASMFTDVNRALAKVDDGTYGTCERCGKPIGDDRMEYRPTSRFCIECKQRQ